MAEQELCLDWHEARKFGHNFVTWLVLTTITAERGDGFGDDRFEELSAATDNFTDVRIGMTINDIPVNAERFIAQLEKQYDLQVSRAAHDLIEEHTRLSDIEEILSTARTALAEKLPELTEGTWLSEA